MDCSNHKFVLENSFSARLKNDPSLLGSNITDVVAFKTDKFKTIIAADCNNKRIKRFCFHHGKTTLSSLEVESEPRGLAKITEHTVVVSLHGVKQLCFIRIDSDIFVTFRVKTDKEYYGLAAISDDTIAASAPWHHPPTVDVISTKGRVLRSINRNVDGINLFSSPKYLTVSPCGDILVSDILNISLTCVTSSEHVKWVYQPNNPDTLAEPRGIACNSKGEIFLAENHLHKILKLSADGVLLGNVLTRCDDVIWPVSVFINEDNKLYISQAEGQIKVYKCQ